MPFEDQQAFPTRYNCGLREGMLLRDYFAAKSLESMILIKDVLPHPAIVKQAYQWADLMMEERSK